jgi:hypothetical protein
MQPAAQKGDVERVRLERRQLRQTRIGFLKVSHGIDLARLDVVHVHKTERRH